MKRAILVMFLLVAVVVGGTLIWEYAYDDYALKAKEIARTAGSAEYACAQIVELIRVFPALVIHQSDRAVHDARAAVDHPGCRIGVSGRNVPLIDGYWPHEVLREGLAADRWREDISRAADGAGSTAFAIQRDSATCLFSASWTLNDWTAPEPTADEYRLEVGCFEKSPR